MNSTDLRVLTAALGFTAVVIKGKEGMRDNALRAMAIANLIQEFCHTHLPDVFDADGSETDRLDRVIEQLKSSLQNKHQADLPENRAAMLRLYDRLRWRFASYATDDMLANRILQLLDDELEHKDEDMRIVNLASENPEKKFEVYQRMATAIVEIIKETGGCLPQDLIAKGFTHEKIDQYWTIAKALAYRGRS